MTDATAKREETMREFEAGVHAADFRHLVEFAIFFAAGGLGGYVGAQLGSGPAWEGALVYLAIVVAGCIAAMAAFRLHGVLALRGQIARARDASRRASAATYTALTALDPEVARKASDMDADALIDEALEHARSWQQHERYAPLAALDHEVATASEMDADAPKDDRGRRQERQQDY